MTKLTTIQKEAIKAVFCADGAVILGAIVRDSLANLTDMPLDWKINIPVVFATAITGGQIGVKGAEFVINTYENLTGN